MMTLVVSTPACNRPMRAWVRVRVKVRVRQRVRVRVGDVTCGGEGFPLDLIDCLVRRPSG